MGLVGGATQTEEARGVGCPWDTGVGVGYLTYGGASAYLLTQGLGATAPFKRSRSTPVCCSSTTENHSIGLLIDLEASILIKFYLAAILVFFPLVSMVSIFFSLTQQTLHFSRASPEVLQVRDPETEEGTI